jgi:ATP-dependent RNA helicase DeaD
LDKVKPKQAIIFCNSRRNAEKLHDHLKKKMPSTEIIHGGLDQSRRTSLFRRFQRMEIKIMVATDLAGRGLDFAHASHVINYEFPKTTDTYTHRTGRTARMGRKGVAMTLFTKGDLRSVKAVIDVNRIQPIWEGEEPDFKCHPKKHQSGKRSSRIPRGRGKRPNRRK